MLKHVPAHADAGSVGHRFAIRPYFVAAFVLFASTAQAENWPGWRGPRGDGGSGEAHVPTTWDGPEGRNIAWKTAVPGKGHSSPIVWEDRVFVTTCLTDTEERVLLCLRARDGRENWRQTVLRSPLEKKHSLNSFASATPATDGRHVYVAFLDGTEMVVAAYDLDGSPQWQVRPGEFSSIHGFCSCPVIFEDLLIVNGDHDGDSYIVALRRDTGATAWKVPRQHKTRSYVTPIIRQIDGRTQMILSGSKSVTSYDPRDGSLHWSIDGPTEQFVASMVYDGRLLFMTCGYPEHHVLAIRPDGHGDVTDTHIAWRATKGASYVPSPVACGGYFLVISDDGIASCFESASGNRVWMERLGTHYSSSLVTAGGLVYFLDEAGITKVVRPGPSLDIVAENALDEECYASPAISEGRIYVRTQGHLVAIGQESAVDAR
jgi:outer membrane protein assembly factor BamB